MSNRITPMMQLPQRSQLSHSAATGGSGGGRGTGGTRDTTTTTPADGSATTHPPPLYATSITSSAVNTETISAIPTLRVMRLQKPELNIATTIPTVVPSSAATASELTPSVQLNRQYQPLQMIETNPSILQSALCLPDSLTVYVGETFTAYLGVLNTPSTMLTTAVPITHYPTIRRLTVVAQLQTPSQRYPLPSRLDPQQQQSTIATPTTDTSTPVTNGSTGGIDVPPFSGVDAIVSHTMEEAGQHILRVEVGYYSPPDLLHYQTFRKFYRFNVKLPLYIQEKYTIRDNDTSCYTCLQIENPISDETTNMKQQDSLVLSNLQFVTPDGLIATNITERQRIPNTTATNSNATTNTITTISPTPTAIDLFDQIQTMTPGSTVSYIYHIQTNTPEATLRGIAIGDRLGHLSVQWYKAMGEFGTLQQQQQHESSAVTTVSSSSLSSISVYCPAAGTTKYDPTAMLTTTTSNNQQQKRHQLSAITNHDNDTNTSIPRSSTAPQIVMYRSGLSVDVAATAASTATSSTGIHSDLDDALHLITVEPVDPPLEMQLYIPVTVPLLIVNHSRHPCTIQIQFNIPTASNINDSTSSANSSSSGIVVSGTTHQNIGTIQSHGGSTVTNFTFVPIQTGLLSIQYCSIMDVTSSGRTIVQPPLWMTYVTNHNDHHPAPQKVNA